MNNHEKQNVNEIKENWLKQEKYLRILIIKIFCVIGLIIISLIFANTVINVLSVIISLVADTLSIFEFIKIYKGKE